MIIKINGNVIEYFPTCHQQKIKLNIKPYLPKNKREARKWRKLAIWLWSISGTFLLKTPVLAAGNDSMWSQMQPLWSVFQEMSMVIGGIAIFVGLLIFYFKRSLGKTVIMSSILVVAGCYLVPSALMLIAIIGSMMNDVLTNVFEHLDLKNSVKVGG